MKQVRFNKNASGFGTMPVYFTVISSILGAILFLRLGMATGTLGFWGATFMILLGHLITIPTAMAISELASNTRVEGGGAYYIISRSFGLKIGSTIGITLYISQAISVAFYTIAFAEVFEPLFAWWTAYFGFPLPRQVLSIPLLVLLTFVILRKGAGSGFKMLYFVNILLFVVLLFFFLGKPVEPGEDPTRIAGDSFGFLRPESFFVIFAICFPAFTGITSGVGLSGDLKDPGRSIPHGTIAGTLTGLAIYLLAVWKLAACASQADLLADQLIMSRIALFGAIIIPVGLAASTSSSAIGSFLVAPRTLQAIALDRSFPFRRINLFLSRGKGKKNEPNNASLVTFFIALVFVLLGDINSVAEIITMFFLITYGTLCLISFLNHFGSPPSYRPRFKSKWYLSLGGFILSVWVMFMINPLYTFLSYVVIAIIYLLVDRTNKDRKGVGNMIKGVIFQLNRQLQVYIQKQQSSMDHDEWRPAAICISAHSFERDKVLELMRWISHHHGFGTYFHLIEGYYSKQTYRESKEILNKLIAGQKDRGSTLYIDTMISPSYTSAIAQVIQAPSISGMENNMVVFEYDKHSPDELYRILENVKLAKAGEFDICIFAGSMYPIRNRNGIHVWIHESDDINTNLMILLGYIIMSHPDWRQSEMRLYVASAPCDTEEVKEHLRERIAAGRLPITLANIEIIVLSEEQNIATVVAEYSERAGLVILGFHEGLIKHEEVSFFSKFDGIGDILFVNASSSKEIN